MFGKDSVGEEDQQGGVVRGPSPSSTTSPNFKAHTRYETARHQHWESVDRLQRMPFESCCLAFILRTRDIMINVQYDVKHPDASQSYVHIQ